MARDSKSDWRKLRDKRKKEREKKADGPPTSLNPAPAPKNKPGVSSRGAKNTNYSPKRASKSAPKPGKKPGYGTDNMPSAVTAAKGALGISDNKSKASKDKGQQTVEYTVKKMPATPAKSKSKSSPSSSPPKKASKATKKTTKANKDSKSKAWWKGPSKSEAKRVQNRFSGGKK
jgi:hypothetical protein